MLILCLLLVCFGALPLAVFLIKRNRYRHILANGVETMAMVKEVRVIRHYRGPVYDSVLFWYLPRGASQYQQGRYSFSRGTYRTGDQFPVFYLPAKPAKHAIPGSKKLEKWVLLFFILFFFFVVFVSYKIYQATRGQHINFNP